MAECLGLFHLVPDALVATQMRRGARSGGLVVAVAGWRHTETIEVLLGAR